MESAMTFLSVLCGAGLAGLGWRMWRNAMREILRDRLIDLRDEWREHFAGGGLDMAAPAYGMVRGMLNGQLLHTGRLRIGGFLYAASRVDAGMRARCSERYAAALAGCGGETRRKAESIRSRASNAVLLYVASSSCGFVLCLGYLAARLVSRPLARTVSRGFRNVFRIDDTVVECASGALPPGEPPGAAAGRASFS